MINYNKQLDSLNMPWAGDKGILSADNTTMELGYAFEKDNSLRRILWDGLKHYAKYQKPIYCFGYVQDPNSTTLRSDRRACYNHFKKYFNFYIYILQKKILISIFFFCQNYQRKSEREI